MFELWPSDWCRKYARRAAVQFIALEDIAVINVLQRFEQSLRLGRLALEVV